jgi:cell wall assembly regulator SMI1
MSRFPVAWPADLVRCYQLHDGAYSGEMWSGVLPGWDLLSLDAMISTVEMYAQIFPDPSTADATEAGETALDFLPSFVPIATNGTGCTLFVDTRPGEKFGCVTGFMREDADTYGPIWESVEAMLDDVADALEQSRPSGGWQPTVEDNALTWEPADD